MGIGFSDGTNYADQNEWLADSFAKVMGKDSPVSQMTEQGNIDLTSRPRVQTPEGTATVRSMSFGTDKGEVLVPTVHPDGYIMSNDEAMKRYFDTGEHLGIFPNSDSADRYAKMLHESQEDLYLKRPLGSPTEPAGALKSTEGTQAPENGQKVNPGLSMVGAVQDWASRQATIPDKLLNAARSLGNPNFEEDKKFIQGFYESVKNFFTLPGEVYAGKIDPMSPQGIEKAAEMASMMVFGPMPVASKMADGTLGSFIGVKGAKNINVHQERGLAQILESKGESPEDILQKTGWFRGADDKWRYEIDDSKAKFDPNWVGTKATKVETPTPKDPFEQVPFNPMEGKYVAKLGDVLDHPELYKAYPNIKDLNLVYDNDMPPGVLGYFDKPNNAIVLSESVTGNKGVIMHEIQHMIQDEENFAKGGMALQAGKGYQLRFQKDAEAHFREMAKFHEKIQEKIDKNVPFTDKELEKLDFYDKLSNLYIQYVESANDKASDLYTRLAGEVEAVNTDTRLLLSKENRRDIPPWETEDVGRSSQIVTPKVVSTTAYGVWDPDARFYRDYPKPEARIIEPTSPRWANNDNIRPLNGHEQFIKDYDALHALGESLGTPFNNKYGSDRKWSDLDYQRYNKAGREFAKKHGQTWEDVKPLK